jgi:hypothetical protein
MVARPSIPADGLYPATYRERGVAVPFTAPLLTGMRLRSSTSGPPELVASNPAGERGVFVLHWPKDGDRYRPTVHDSLLMRRLTAAQDLTPSNVRIAALEVALEGFSGHAAKAAAEKALATDRRQQHRMAHQLYLLLLEQVGQQRLAGVAASDMEGMADAVLHRLALSLGRSRKDISDALSGLTAAFAPIGVPPEDEQARYPRLIRLLQHTRADLAGSVRTADAIDDAMPGQSMIAMMDLVLSCAGEALAASRTLLGDPGKTLRQWIAGPDKMAAELSRVAWILDGWERICLLWRLAGNGGSRRMALLEMAELMPALPVETMAWCPRYLPWERLDPAWRAICQNETWRIGGAAIRLVGRNEALRGMNL